MSRHRFFLDAALPVAEPGAAVIVPLSPSDLHHAVSVLRVRVGEELDVVDPAGIAWRVRVRSATPDALTATVAEELVEASRTTAHVTLVFGVSKGSKNDDIVEGAVEVGAAEILPILTARSIVRFDSEKRAERGQRWRRVALAAAKQSKRASVPRIGDPASLGETLPLLAACDLVLVAWEEREPTSRGVRAAIAEARATGRLGRSDGRCETPLRVAVVVGPKGGLAAEEIAALERIGAVCVTLGATIMRAETAAVVAAALVIHEFGGLGNAL